MSNESFAEKYRARSYSDIVGQEKAITEIKNFLENFKKPRAKKALILYGSAGTGKTSLVIAAAKENNLEIFELNSSDLRNRKKLEEVLKPAVEQSTLTGKGKLILMDEVDGVTGTDIGGIPELARAISITRHPIIMTCNDVWQSKLSPIRIKSKLAEMKPLQRESTFELLKNTAEKEGIKTNAIFLNQIAIKSQGDIRAALNDLQSYSEGEDLFVDITEKRDIEESIFNILRKLFKDREPFLQLFENTKMSLDEILLWIEENIPKEYKNEALTKAYFALGNADVFRGRIYRNQSWRFLIYQNIFQSAGVSFAKDTQGIGFTKYERPKRILKIWLNNQKIARKKTISKKYARMVHCSTKRIMRDFQLLIPILRKSDVQNEIQLSNEEIAYLNQ